MTEPTYARSGSITKFYAGSCSTCLMTQQPTESYQEAGDWLFDHFKREHPGMRCGQDVAGTVPSWAGEDQVSPCRCYLTVGHEGQCKCSHDLEKQERGRASIGENS